MAWAGWAMSGLMIAFMLFDSLSKLALERHVIAATTQIGYPAPRHSPPGRDRTRLHAALCRSAHLDTGRHPAHGLSRRRRGQ
ncbi:MAG: DoxX family protein [Caulobacteraceae bacterium]